MTDHLPTLAQAKNEAKHLRSQQATAGETVSHAKSLELIAHHYGMRDWNTLSAAIHTQNAPSWTVGARVNGTYLGHPFDATIVAVRSFKEGWYKVELQLDEAIDVVTSQRFSNLRKRLRGTIGPKGRSAEHTSNGIPHLQLNLN